MSRSQVPVLDVAPVAASLTTALSGSNNDITFTARAGGVWGNNIQIAYVDSGFPNTGYVIVEGYLISVYLGNDGGITTTADRILTLIESSADARALVSAALAGGSGSGFVTAMAATPLAGGIYGVEQLVAVNGDRINGHYFTGNDGRVIIEVVATTTSPQTVTIERAPAFVAGITMPDEVVTIPAGEVWELGPFPEAEFNQNSDRDVYFAPSESDAMDFRAYRVTRVT